MGSVAAGHGLSCSIAWGIFSDQGSNSSPALADGFFPTEPPGKPSSEHFPENSNSIITRRAVSRAIPCGPEAAQGLLHCWQQKEEGSAQVSIGGNVRIQLTG